MRSLLGWGLIAAAAYGVYLLWLDQNNQQAGVPAAALGSTLQKAGDAFNGYTLVALGSGPVITVGINNSTGNPVNDYIRVPRGSVLKYGQIPFTVGGEPSDLQGGVI